MYFTLAKTYAKRLLPNELIFLIKHFEQLYYLSYKTKGNLTEIVRSYNHYLPRFFRGCVHFFL